MAYIGRGLDKISNIEKLDAITFDGSQSYSLTKSSVAFTPNSANSLIISINGVCQFGNVTVSGTSVDFGVAMPSTDTNDFILHLGVGVVNTPADATVTNAKLAQDIISGETELAVAPADTDEFLVSDAGTLKRIDYSLIKGAGKVLQVVQGTDTSERSTTSTSYVSMTLNASITPSATSSKVLVIAQAAFGISGTGEAYFDIARDIGGAGYVSLGGGQGFGQINSGDATGGAGALVTLNAPSTTSACNYRVDAAASSGDTAYVGRGGFSTIILIEIGA